MHGQVMCNPCTTMHVQSKGPVAPPAGIVELPLELLLDGRHRSCRCFSTCQLGLRKDASDDKEQVCMHGRGNQDMLTCFVRMPMHAHDVRICVHDANAGS